MRKLFLAASVMSVLATGARADVVSFNTYFDVKALASVLGDDHPLFLTAFDPSLGSLMSASVELRGRFQLPPYPLLLEGGTPPTMASVAPYIYVYPLTPAPFTFETQANRPVVNGQVTGLQSFSFDLTGLIPLNYAADPFLNLAPYAIVINANGVYDQADTGDFDPSEIYGIASVSYTYTSAAAVPEPASLAVLAVGGVVATFARRYRKPAAAV